MSKSRSSRHDGFLLRAFEGPSFALFSFIFLAGDIFFVPACRCRPSSAALHREQVKCTSSTSNQLRRQSRLFLRASSAAMALASQLNTLAKKQRATLKSCQWQKEETTSRARKDESLSSSQWLAAWESHTVAKRLFQELEGNNSRKRETQRLSLYQRKVNKQGIETCLEMRPPKNGAHLVTPICPWERKPSSLPKAQVSGTVIRSACIITCSCTFNSTNKRK